MLRRIRLLAEARDVVRPVLVCTGAVAIVATVMAVTGRHITSIALGGVLVLISAVMVYQVDRAVRQLQGQSDLLRQASSEAESHYLDVLRRVVSFVEARDRYWNGHSRNVARLAERVGRKMGLSRGTCERLALAGQLHDIGMLAVPQSVLLDYSRFGVNEFRSVQKHPEVSYEVLRPLTSVSDILPAIRHHHERMNGTGYPQELRGEDIPLGARILAVADAYDAMTHDRPHREGMTSVQAVAELRRCTPAGYDPACVDALAEVVHVRELNKTPARSQGNRRPKMLTGVQTP